jgi:ribosomal protein L37AE/L43A
METFTCPKCQRPAERSGEVSVGRDTYPVYQCETCVVKWTLGATTLDAAFTFAVDAYGRAFDPADPNDAPSG